MLGLMSDTVFQIREEAVNLLITLKDQGSSVFTEQWLEDSLETKTREFHTHEKFAQRIQTIFLILKVSDKVKPRFLNEKLIPFSLKLAEDPVPNIRFNFAKMVERLYDKMTPSNKLKAEEALQKMIENEKIDFDVKYFAEKALKAINPSSDAYMSM